MFEWALQEIQNLEFQNLLAGLAFTQVSNNKLLWIKLRAPELSGWKSDWLTVECYKIHKSKKLARLHSWSDSVWMRNDWDWLNNWLKWRSKTIWTLLARKLWNPSLWMSYLPIWMQLPKIVFFRNRLAQKICVFFRVYISLMVDGFQ